jgi:hypothetical protein
VPRREACGSPKKLSGHRGGRRWTHRCRNSGSLSTLRRCLLQRWEITCRPPQQRATVPAMSSRNVRLRIERHIRENAQDCPAASGAYFLLLRSGASLPVLSGLTAGRETVVKLCWCRGAWARPGPWAAPPRARAAACAARGCTTGHRELHIALCWVRAYRHRNCSTPRAHPTGTEEQMNWPEL